MPMVLPFLSGFISVFGYGGGVYLGAGAAYAGAAAAGTAFAGWVINTALVMGLSLLASKVMAPSIGSLGGQLKSPVQAMPSKKFVYGQTRVGGNYVYIGTSNAYTDTNGDDTVRDKLLHMVLEVAGHPIESFQNPLNKLNDDGTGDVTVFINDNEISLEVVNDQKETDIWPNSSGTDANGVTRYRPVGPDKPTSYNNYLGFKFYDGTQLLADADLVEAMTYGDDNWTANHIGKDRAYVYIRAHYNPELFTGFPEVNFYLKGKNDIKNPCASARGGISAGGTGYTKNTALIVNDYITTPRYKGGLGETEEKIDANVLDASAATCDEVVTVFEDNTTQTRYFMAGQVDSGQSPNKILSEMLSTMSGWTEKVNGKWHIRSGEYSPPVMTITESEMRDVPLVTLNNSFRDIANSVKPAMRAPETDWQPALAKTVEALTRFNVTPDHTTDVFTAAGHPVSDRDRVRFNYITGAGEIDPERLPTQIGAETFYYVVNQTASTFQISANKDGTPLDFSSNGGPGTMYAEFDPYLTQDGERKSSDVVYSLVPDETLARRLSMINLLLVRQEIVASLRLKIGTNWAAPFDLTVGDSLRWIDAHKNFWEVVADQATWPIATDGTITHAAHGHSDGDPVSFTDTDVSGLGTGFPYYVVNSTTNTFQVASYRGGSAIASVEATDVEYSTIQGKLFRVVGWKPDFLGGTPGLTVEVQETNPEIYTWQSGKEVAPEVRSSITVRRTGIVDDPTNLVVTSGTAVLLIRKDGTIVSRAKLAWDPATDAYTQQGGYVDIEYKESADTDWISWGDVTGGSVEAFVADLNDDTDYDFRIRFRNSFGAVSDWDTVSNHTLAGKTLPPADPTSFVAAYSSEDNSIALGWVDPSDIDLADIQLWRRIGYGEVLANIVKGATLNGNFETDGTGGADVFANWSESATSPSTVTKETALQRTGSACARFNIGSGQEFVSITLSSIFTGAKTYEYRVWARRVGATAVTIQVNITDASHQVSYALPQEWTLLEGTFTTTANASFQLKRVSGANGVALFDDVEVNEVDPGYKFQSSIPKGLQAFNDLVLPTDRDVVYYYQIKSRDTTNNESGAVSASDTVDKIASPASLAITTTSLYYEFDVSWTAGPANDWIVVQWWFDSDSENKKVVWVPYNEGSARIEAAKLSAVPNSALSITARAWHVSYIRGVQVVSEPTSRVAGTVNRWPVPTGLGMTMQIDFQQGTSTTDFDFVIPVDQKPYVQEIQLWDNTDLELGYDTLEDSTTDRNVTTLDFPANTWVSVQPSETWPKAGVLYLRGGLPSEMGEIDFTNPATTGQYTFP